MYRLSVDKEIETAQSDFSCLSDVDSVGSNLQALKNELDKTKEELDKIDNFDISAKNNTTRANATAYPRENSPAHDDCTDDMEVIKASDGRVEGNSDDWSSCSAILGDGTEERNTGKFWQCAKNTVSTTIKLVEEVKAMRSERESLRHELALSKAEVDLLQQKVKKGVSSKYGSINGSCNLLEIENEMLMHSADVDGQRHSTALEPDVRDDGHTNFEEEETTQRRRAIEMKMNSFISKLNGVERHTTQLAAFDDDDLSDGKCMFHDPKGLMEASMPHTRSDTQEIAREGGQHMKAHEFIDLSQQVKELQGTVKRQLKELEELQSLRERDAKESMMLQSMLQGKLLKLQETVQEQASQLHVIRDLRELVKELKAMTMTTGEKRHQNPFVTGSSRSPPNLTPRHWCENSEALDLECSAINGEHDVTNHKAELARLKFRLESRLEQIFALQLERMYTRVTGMEKDLITEGRKTLLGQRSKLAVPMDHENELRFEIMKERALCEKALREREEAEKQLQRVLAVARHALVKTLGGGGRDGKAEKSSSERVVDRLLRRTVK